MNASQMGKKGGKRRAEVLSAEEKSKIARKAINARWKKYRAEKRAEKAEAKRASGENAA